MPLPKFVNGKIPSEEDSKIFVQTTFNNHKDPELELVTTLSNPPNKLNILVNNVKNYLSKKKSKPPAPQPAAPPASPPAAPAPQPAAPPTPQPAITSVKRGGD